MALMLGVSGLRGTAGSELTRDIVVNITRAFVSFMNARTVVIGRDTRPSSLPFAKAVSETINRAGGRTIDLDVVPTPTVLFVTRRIKADAGIVITASHNPIQYNGLKFACGRGEFLDAASIDRFLAYLRRPVPGIFADLTGTTVRFGDALDRHIGAVVKLLPPVSGAGFKVAVDAVSGAGSQALPALLERLGCKVFRLNCDFRPVFPRPPEPTPDNLSDLCRLVAQERCDLGFAVDPDCDRLSIVDDRACPIGEENTIVLAVEQVLASSRHRRQAVVATNLSTTARLDYVTRRHHARLVRTPVGEAHVVEAIKKYRAQIGGEGNGGVIFPRINITRDALIGAALVVRFLAGRHQRLADLLAGYPPLFMIKESVEATRERFLNREQAIRRAFRGRVLKRDGLKIVGKDGWLHIRPSNTEPVVRIIAEAGDRKTVERIVKTARRLLKK